MWLNDLHGEERGGISGLSEKKVEPQASQLTTSHPLTSLHLQQEGTEGGKPGVKIKRRRVLREWRSGQVRVTRQRERRGARAREQKGVISISPHLTASEYQAADALRGTQNPRGTHHHQLAKSKMFFLLRSSNRFSSQMGGSTCH